MDPGARLREARVARGLSLENLARTTRIAAQKLAALERNDVSVFPPGPYAHGFVRAYAAELGLDPEETAREYLAQFHAAPPPIEAHAPDRTHAEPDAAAILGERSWKGPALAGSALLAFVIAWAAWPSAPQSGRNAQLQEPEAVGTAGAGVAPADEPPAASAPADLTVTLEAAHPAWVSATADGERVIFRTLQPGEREVLRATREIVLRVGDAGPLRWSRGTGAAEVMGPRGAVRTIRLTPDNPR
jgi:cytoskeleton protein RodZ